MLKRITAISLIVLLFSSSCSLFFIYAGFEMNQKYIAENLCVNRDKPWLHCNGKCFFIKKIRQAEENERKQEAKDNLNRLEISILQEPFTIAFIAPILIKNTKPVSSNYRFSCTNSYINSIFRPPKQMA